MLSDGYLLFFAYVKIKDLTYGLSCEAEWTRMDLIVFSCLLVALPLQEGRRSEPVGKTRRRLGTE